MLGEERRVEESWVCGKHIVKGALVMYFWGMIKFKKRFHSPEVVQGQDGHIPLKYKSEIL